MKKILQTLIIFLTLFDLNSQVNLVPNPSFEFLDSCPQFLGEFSIVDWVKPTWGSTDNFSICSTEQSGVPQNVVGWQHPKTGSAYIGTYGSDFSGNNYREYIQCQLLSPLEIGKQYEVSFWLSRADSSTFACNNIGAYLSLTPVFLAGNNNLPYAPQVVNENIITDAINWVQIIDTITAIGSEKYLTIGVFTDDDNTNRVPVNGGWMSEFYYYYDDVSIVCLDCTTRITETKNDNKISVFPNPATNYLNIKFNDVYPEKITLFSNLGETLLVQKQVIGNIQINISEYQGGIYFLKIETKDFSIITQFFITK